jgi:hypothetical protein
MKRGSIQNIMPLQMNSKYNAFTDEKFSLMYFSLHIFRRLPSGSMLAV